jgi:hypothetical protein
MTTDIGQEHDALVVEREFRRAPVVSPEFAQLLEAVRAHPDLLDAAQDPGGMTVIDLDEPTHPIAAAAAAVGHASDMPVVLGAARVMVTRGDLGVLLPTAPESRSALKPALDLPKIHVVKDFVAQVRALVTSVVEREPSAAVPESGEVTVERWSGQIVHVEDDHVWAQFFNEEDDREEDVELLPDDVQQLGVADLRVGTALEWTFERWTDETNTNCTRSRFEVIRPAAIDAELASTYRAGWQRAAAHDA